ncbi:MAG: hypothetical protein ACREGF_05025, partial [Candidatus Saccharimonadales bacterium]
KRTLFMNGITKKLSLGASTLGSVGLLVGMVGGAAAQSSGGQTFKADLSQLNGSGASGTATIVLNGTSADITANVTGVLAGSPHAQHLHWDAKASHTCPSASARDQNGGLLTVADAVPQYGGVDVSLTTTGDTSPNSALAITRFPAPKTSSYSYNRTITLTSDQVTHLTSGQYVFVVHGLDANNDGKYDGTAKSSLDPSLPLEATAPAACGVVTASSNSSNGAAMHNNSSSSSGSMTTGNQHTGEINAALTLGIIGTLLGIIAVAMAAKKGKA